VERQALRPAGGAGHRFGIARRDILAQAGFDRPPASIDELRDYAIALTRRGSNGALTRTGLDVQSIDPGRCSRPCCSPSAATCSAPGGRRSRPTGVAALQWVADLQLKDRVIDAGFSNPNSTTLPLADGRAAMSIGHNNAWITTSKQRPEVLGQLQPFLLNPAKPSVFSGGTLVTVSAPPTSVRRPGAGRLHRQPPGILRGAAQRGNVPPLTELEDTPYVRDHPLVKFGLENLKYGRSEGGIRPGCRCARDPQHRAVGHHRPPRCARGPGPAGHRRRRGDRRLRNQ